MKSETGIVVGQSGVGKSSLINRLVPDAEISVGTVSAATSEGIHTTTASAMHRPRERSGSNDDQLMDAYATFRTPSHDAMVHEQVERVERAFDELPVDYRELITLHRIAGLSYAEIAGQLNTTEEAVRKKLARAMARLSRILRASTERET